MKYQFNKYANASNAMKKLMALDFKFKDAYNIYKLAHQLDAIMQIGMKRERELIEKYGGKVMPNGYVDFADGKGDKDDSDVNERIEGFQKEYGEMYNTEIDEDIEPIKISLEAMGEKAISPNDIMSLEGFVTFE